jgi:hypothetical protein
MSGCSLQKLGAAGVKVFVAEDHHTAAERHGLGQGVRGGGRQEQQQQRHVMRTRLQPLGPQRHIRSDSVWVEDIGTLGLSCCASVRDFDRAAIKCVIDSELATSCTYDRYKSAKNS